MFKCLNYFTANYTRKSQEEQEYDNEAQHTTDESDDSGESIRWGREPEQDWVRNHMKSGETRDGPGRNTCILFP